jgi:hypothetical protein
MQKVHFSITPVVRTLTSGFRDFARGSGQTGSKKLKKRTV